MRKNERSSGKLVQAHKKMRAAYEKPTRMVLREKDLFRKIQKAFIRHAAGHIQQHISRQQRIETAESKVAKDMEIQILPAR